MLCEECKKTAKRVLGFMGLILSKDQKIFHCHCREEKIIALESISGMLNELSPKQIIIFEKALYGQQSSKNPSDKT